MNKKADAIITAIEAMIKQSEGIVFVQEKMVSSSHLIKVRVKALKDVIQLIEDYCDEADENNELFEQGSG